MYEDVLFHPEPGDLFRDCCDSLFLVKKKVSVMHHGYAFRELMIKSIFPRVSDLFLGSNSGLGLDPTCVTDRNRGNSKADNMTRRSQFSMCWPRPKRS